jgi:hypothetical protein
MIAAFENGDLHAVFSVARRGLKAITIGYCRTEGNAGDGTLQVPDWAFDGRETLKMPMVVTQPFRVCTRCAAAIKLLREPPQDP